MNRRPLRVAIEPISDGRVWRHQTLRLLVPWVALPAELRGENWEVETEYVPTFAKGVLRDRIEVFRREDGLSIEMAIRVRLEGLAPRREAS